MRSQNEYILSRIHLLSIRSSTVIVGWTVKITFNRCIVDCATAMRKHIKRDIYIFYLVDYIAMYIHFSRHVVSELLEDTLRQQIVDNGVCMTKHQHAFPLMLSYT